MTELNINLCIIYIVLHHGTLYVELTLFIFHTLWGQCLQIDREFPCFDLPPLENACVKNTPYTFLLKKMYTPSFVIILKILRHIESFEVDYVFTYMFLCR